MSSPPPQDLLKQYFGFDRFRPGQREVMSALWRHKAALAVFPTGGGKSLCYQLPALMLPGLTLVISPLIALMNDQIAFLRSRNIPAEKLDSTLNAQQTADVMRRCTSGETRILYIAPERFNNERFLRDIKQVQISLFAVDEAHCISEWGHNFRPDYLKLAEAAKAVSAERVLALTATATPGVVEDICKGFEIPEDAAVITGFYRHNLTMLLTAVDEANRDRELVNRLKTRPAGSTIVYVTLQKTAERVANFLRDQGLPARAYHAGMEDVDRLDVQNEWMTRPDGIVVATIAFGMGIDKSDVRYVYHYNLPKGLESYSQEIGRAGRDDRQSIVEMLLCLNDIPVLENFAYGDTPTLDAVRELVRQMVQSGTDFDVSLSDLSSQLDIRQLVLRTALTYLELMEIVKQGTPFFQNYSIRLTVPEQQVLGLFPGEPGEFLRKVMNTLDRGKSGKAVWWKIDPDAAAAVLGQESRRVKRALDVLQERGLAEVRMTDLRHRYALLKPSTDTEIENVAREIHRRFEHRERREILRIQAVVRLAKQPDCQTNALVRYFGEERAEPCGHCSFCLNNGPASPVPAAVPDPPDLLDLKSFDVLREQFAEALASPRQAARFLCGITSPGISRARIGSHPLFGALERCKFPAVLKWLNTRKDSE